MWPPIHKLLTVSPVTLSLLGKNLIYVIGEDAESMECTFHSAHAAHDIEYEDEPNGDCHSGSQSEEGPLMSLE